MQGKVLSGKFRQYGRRVSRVRVSVKIRVRFRFMYVCMYVEVFMFAQHLTA